jgi:hypothetical protein
MFQMHVRALKLTTVMELMLSALPVFGPAWTAQLPLPVQLVWPQFRQEIQQINVCVQVDTRAFPGHRSATRASSRWELREESIANTMALDYVF